MTQYLHHTFGKEISHRVCLFYETGVSFACHQKLNNWSNGSDSRSVWMSGGGGGVVVVYKLEQVLCNSSNQLIFLNKLHTWLDKQYTGLQSNSVLSWQYDCKCNPFRDSTFFGVPTEAVYPMSLMKFQMGRGEKTMSILIYVIQTSAKSVIMLSKDICCSLRKHLWPCHQSLFSIHSWEQIYTSSVNYYKMKNMSAEMSVRGR
jgi:hypothetical protein